MASYRPVLYYSSLSPDCVRIKLAIKRLGVAVEMRNVTVSRRNRAELKEAVGRLEVPCLVVSGTFVHRIEEIEKYLRLRYGVRD